MRRRAGRARCGPSSTSFLTRDCACRERVPARNRLTKRSSRSISACWRSIARPERELARRLLLAPGVPGPGEEARAPGFQLEHRGAHRLEEPAVVGDQHDRRVDRRQALLEPFQRLDVEVVGRLVEQQQVRIAGERARERAAGQLAAREGAQLAVEVVLVKAEAARPRSSRAGASRIRRRAPAAPGRWRTRRASPGRRRPPAIACSSRASSSSVATSSPQPVSTYSRSVRPWSRGGRWSCSATRAPFSIDQLALVDRRLARRASAAASSCPSRCGRTASAGRGARP